MTPPSTTNGYPNPNATLGLDMSHIQPSYQSNTVGLTFDQNLGLNLSPGYDCQFNNTNGCGVDMTLGLDMMSEFEVVPRQKEKKVAWVEISKVIDGKSSPAMTTQLNTNLTGLQSSSITAFVWDGRQDSGGNQLTWR